MSWSLVTVYFDEAVVRLWPAVCRVQLLITSAPPPLVMPLLKTTRTRSNRPPTVVEIPLQTSSSSSCGGGLLEFLAVGLVRAAHSGGQQCERYNTECEQQQQQHQEVERHVRLSTDTHSKQLEAVSNAEPRNTASTPYPSRPKEWKGRA